MTGFNIDSLVYSLIGNDLTKNLFMAQSN